MKLWCRRFEDSFDNGFDGQAGGRRFDAEQGGEKRAERFLSSQADTFAGANVKGKSIGLLRSK